MICGDNVDVLSKFDDEIVDLTITSPPYRNAIDYDMHVKHGNSSQKNYRGKLSIKVPKYIEEIGSLFNEVKRVTRDGGYCCIVIGNEINKGTLEPLPALLVAKLNQQGWNLHEEIIWHKVTGGDDLARAILKSGFTQLFG